MKQQSNLIDLVALLIALAMVWFIVTPIYDFFDKINDELMFIYPPEEKTTIKIEIR